MVRRRGKGLTLFLVLLVAVSAVTAYSAGWLKMDSTSDQTTIEVETGEIKDAASEAAAEAEKLVRKTGDGLEEAGQVVTEEVEKMTDPPPEQDGR